MDDDKIKEIKLISVVNHEAGTFYYLPNGLVFHDENYLFQFLRDHKINNFTVIMQRKVLSEDTEHMQSFF